MTVGDDAPVAVLRRPREGCGGHSRSAAILPPELIPARILEWLCDRGVRDLDDWLHLTRRQRRAFWGVTTAIIDLLDQIARGRLA